MWGHASGAGDWGAPASRQSGLGSLDRRWLALVGLAVSLSCLLAAVCSATRLGTDGSGWLGSANNVMLAFASGLFLAGGVLWLCRWRLLHESHSALVGSALVVLGAVGLPVGGLERLLDQPDLVGLGPAVRGVASVVGIGLVLRASAPEPAGPRTGWRWLARQLSWQLAGLSALFLGALTLVNLLLGATAVTGPQQRVVVAAMLAASWIAVSVAVARRSPATAWDHRIPPLFGAMGVAELMRVLDRGTAGSWALGALLLSALVAGLTFRCAAARLDDAVSLDHAHLADVSEALDRARVDIDRYECTRAETAHDARNAVAGLRAALLLLDQYDGRLTERDTAPLRRAAVEELAHLEHLLTRTVEQPSTPFDAAVVVASVVENRRALGAEITMRSSTAVAFGRPLDLRTAVQNLLVNAAVHAPGSPVEVDVVTEGHRVVVTVTDHGPGLSSADASRVFGRGERGRAGSGAGVGSGLGLHVARTLMRSQGGDVELVGREGGATFTLTMPAQPARAAEPAPALVGTTPDRARALEEVFA